MLSLGSNELSSIEPGDFNGLTSLISLDLAYNELFGIRARTLMGCRILLF